MNVNIGKWDAYVRLGLAMVLIVWGVHDLDWWGYFGMVLLLLGAFLLLTVGFGWCPLYQVLGIWTCKRKEPAAADSRKENPVYTGQKMAA